MIFIKNVYHQMLDAGLTYDQALALTKRSFIKGMIDAGNAPLPGTVEYMNPYYWGAFIYYGK
jgi:CHAT domain-containing protein